MSSLKTANGSVVPPIGMGTYPLQGEQIANIVQEGVRIGYRLIDTSDDYRGETGIGLAFERMHQSGEIKREDLFLLTKISDNDAYSDDMNEGIFFNNNASFMQRHSVDDVVRYKVEISLREMKTDYLDGLLIHHPYPGFNEEIWQSFVRLQKEGKVRYIGVSNFYKRHIDSIYSATSVYPSINEIYTSPIGTKEDDLKIASDLGMQLMVYSPLMDVACKRITAKQLLPYMEKYNKTEAQIVLRWNVQRGCLPIPRTKNFSRLKENFDVFDFELTNDEMYRISSLNRNYQCLVDSKLSPGL